MSQDYFLVNPQRCWLGCEDHLAISDPSAPWSPHSVTAHHLLSFYATTVCGTVLQTGPHITGLKYIPIASSVLSGAYF